jgi:inner membrane protein
MTDLAWWGLFFGLCIVLELSSPGYFFFLSFATGALAAATVAWFDVPVMVEAGVFVVVSLAAFFFLRRVAARVAQEGTVKTNVYALEGKKGVVIDLITPLERGWIKVDGEMWAAAPCDDHPLEKGSIVVVVSVAGSHLRVKKVDDL